MANLAGAINETPSMMEVGDGNTPLGHVSKQITVSIGENGVPIWSPNRIYDHAKSTEDPLARPEIKWHPVTESQNKRIDEDQSDKRLQQMTLLFESMKLLGTQMREGFETEGVRRKEYHKNQGFKREQQIQSEMVQGFKNEENARQLVRRNWQS